MLFIGFPFIHDSDQIPKLEKPLCDARCHRRRHSQRIVDADEVVPQGVERDHVTVILESLGERVAQAREAAHVRAMNRH